MPAYERSVFISYAWGEQHEEIVNQIDATLQKRGIKIVRDKRDLGYKGSISQFMERIGQGHCVIIVVSDKYLRSPNCMYELVEIADAKQLHDRIFPIVLKDASIDDPLRRVEYIRHWEVKRAQLAEAIRSLDPANLQGIREEMDLYDRIRDKVSWLTSILKDMNSLTPEMHQDSDFSILYEAIEKRMLEGNQGAAEVAPASTEKLRLYYPTRQTISFTGQPGRKHIFLSYKRGAQPDEALALALYEALSREHEVFIDQIMPVGTEWRERIHHELENCDFLVPLLSSNSARSEMVEYEISTAYQLGRTRGKPAILPVRIAFTAPFEYPLSAYLNPLNWAFWREETDTPSLIDELRTAMAGGQLNLADIREKQALLEAPDSTESGRPTAFADIGQLERPDGTIQVESRFYLERAGDEVCQREVERGGATIVIKAPRQMGKSSLLVRAATQARRLGREVALLDFQLLDETMLNDPERFFQNYSRWIADELEIDHSTQEVWEGGLGHAQSCSKYVRRHVLKGLNKPVTLAMDEVDRMLNCPFRSDFFGMLRSWHNNRATGSEWRQLDLLLVISTEPYLLIDNPQQSPFNVGEVIRPEDFNLSQTGELNDRHGSPFTTPQNQRLYELLHGHPYLTRQAMYRVAVREMDAETLFTRAAEESGPFGDHLRRHLTRFSQHTELAQAMRGILRHQNCPDEVLFSRLQGAGLVRRAGEQIMPRCQLYATYFQERLGDD